ncbi:MAG TPA: choice-of-anchor X domain-containing protein, partial [Acidimicrobiales bacterium]|nr:choice-of-anchor X domain-containing protein [Acidimicrobiales bacterium]
MTRRPSRIAITVVFAVLFGIGAQESRGQVSLTTLGVPYTQNFDTLANTGTANAWTNNTTLAGWYATQQSGTLTTYRADNGASTTGALYSYGSTGSTERALGSLSSGTPQTLYYGVRLVNNTGSAITTLAIAFTGEQWRNGGNATAQTLAFKYQLGATDLVSGTWTAFSSLDFVTPIHTTTAGALDGNAAANRQALSAALNVGVAIGQEIWLRWEDINDTGNDHAVSIDDLSITPSVAATPPSGVGSAVPSSLLAGDSTLLGVTVTPGTNPTSTGLAVTCDASAIGGLSNQTLYDDGTNGDVTAGDNIFSFSTTVAPATSNGLKSLPCSITDAQSRTGSATITLNVISLTKIHDIQGSGNASPLVGNTVTTRGIVTALLSSSFYIEEPDAGQDADVNTSEAISVFTAPTGLSRGDLVTVTGTVQEYAPTGETLQPTTTELASVSSVSVVSSGNPLPTPVTVYATDTDPAGGFYQLEKYEAMRVTFSPSITAVGPTGGTVDEVNATSTSSGWLWGVVTGVGKPFRAVGANVLDPLSGCVSPCVNGSVPRFDGNPERFDIGMKQQVGGTTLDVRAGDVITGFVGIVSFTTSAGYRSWQFFPDPGTGTVSTPGPDAAPVSAANADEFTVATFNMERFFDTVADGESGGAPTLTTTAFNNRLNKASLAVRNYLL